MFQRLPIGLACRKAGLLLVKGNLLNKTCLIIYSLYQVKENT